MRLSVLAVGRLKDGPERALCERYAARIGDMARGLSLSGPEIVELPESRRRRADERRLEEARLIGERLGPGLVVALDETGRDLSSADFAARLGRARDSGAARAQFVVGGADGLAPELRARADLVLAFGRLTLPHQLVRALILEQIYRALTILAGHPYHRD